jgi:sec-independent protein translocase protein TatA
VEKDNKMIGGLGWPELLLILAVVLLVFGVGRISKVGSELGKGISAFREGVREGQEELEKNKENESTESDGSKEQE